MKFSKKDYGRGKPFTDFVAGWIEGEKYARSAEYSGKAFDSQRRWRDAFDRRAADLGAPRPSDGMTEEECERALNDIRQNKEGGEK